MLPLVGSKVTVYTSDGKQFSQYISVGSQYLTQDNTTLTFGLGRADDVSKISVLWPGNKEQVVHGPFKMKQIIEVLEKPSDFIEGG